VRRAASARTRFPRRVLSRAGPRGDLAPFAAAAQCPRLGLLARDSFLDRVLLRVACQSGAAAAHRGDDLAPLVTALAERLYFRVPVCLAIGRPADGAALRVIRDGCVRRVGGLYLVARHCRSGNKRRKQQEKRAAGFHIVAPTTHGANSSSP